MPGSGLSKYRGHDSDVAAICGAALALTTAVGVDVSRTIVVGHSMGAMVASELSQQLRALGTVLIGPVNPSDALAGVFAQRIQLVEKGRHFLNVRINGVRTATYKRRRNGGRRGGCAVSRYRVKVDAVAQGVYSRVAPVAVARGICVALPHDCQRQEARVCGYSLSSAHRRGRGG